MSLRRKGRCRVEARQSLILWWVAAGGEGVLYEQAGLQGDEGAREVEGVVHLVDGPIPGVGRCSARDW